MAWHHVMSRDVDGDGWLTGPEDAKAFLTALRGVLHESGAELHAYCLLPRHYHLLLRARDGGLAATIALVERETPGPAGAPLLALPIVVRRHLAEVSRYIHRNPVEARLVPGAEAWPHSSYRFYAGLRAPCGWLVTEAVLGYFGTVGARHRYRAFVEGHAPFSYRLRGEERSPSFRARRYPRSLARKTGTVLPPPGL